MLLPTKSALIQVTQSGAEVQATYRDKRYVFPSSDVVLLPIPNTTAEMLAWWIAQELRQGLGTLPRRRHGARGRGGRVVRPARLLPGAARRGPADRAGAARDVAVASSTSGSAPTWATVRATWRRRSRASAAHVAIERVSPVYETEPAHVTDQPRFLNLAVKGATALEPADLLAVVKRIESRMGRRPGERYGPRPIDIDILFFGDRVVHTDTLEVPHPRVAERGLRPGPAPRHRAGPPAPGARAHRLRSSSRPSGDTRGIVRVERGLTARLERDVQEESPSARLRLDQTGVTGLHRIIRLADGGGLFYATLDLFVELPPDQKGAHMSRFSDTVEEVLEDLGAFEAPMIETLAERIARALTVGHRAERGGRGDPRPVPARAAGADLRQALAGAVHADRHRRRHPPPHGPADRRGGRGHDGVPLRPGDGPRAGARPGCASTA